jgi:hypothetical protein
MAEVKNSFLKSRMNQDLDDRLIPEGEYRYASNISVGRSSNSDVGTAQTVLGNEKILDFNVLVGIDPVACLLDGSCLECIGYFVDTANSRVFLFLTNYTDTTLNGRYSTTAANYIYLYNSLTDTYSKLVEGAFLNFSKNSPIIGVNLLEDLLFWTDNRNQPRKININSANPSNLTTPTYYTIEDQISVAKISPVHAIELYAESSLVPTEYETTMYDVTSEFLPPGGVKTTVNGAIVSANTFIIDNPGINYVLEAGQIISGAGIPQGVRVVSYDSITFTVVASSNITLTDNQDIKFNANPYYNPDYIGDPTFLNDKFVRFSYRYKFIDNEYSIFAPFTQIAYIPKQDGYFLYEKSDDITLEPIVDDESATYRSSIVSFMYNKVNNILLQIKLPCPANDLQPILKISEIEILYKESDGLAVQVVDIISCSEIAAASGSSDIYEYNYQSKKPFKTLPERDTLRVYDKTPVRAFGQEIISNRVVYSNYQDKQGYPKFLNYNVACNEKSAFNLNSNTTSVIEYPNHTVKQNRNYEVGVVLSDKFGRQSGVILSNALDSALGSGITFGAASLYVPYQKETSAGSGLPLDGVINQWPGLSLKILFNNPIGSEGISDWPGLYNGDSTSIDYNPLGWYSYKIVVKQNEQEYYNVYLPGVMAAYPLDSVKELNKTSHFVLLGDNINKVPRDLNEVSGTQEQYRSSVRLYPRVNNVLADWQNQQFYPGNTFSFVNTIATNNSLFSPPSPLTDPFYQFYNVASNPLIGRLTTNSKLGITTAEAGSILDGPPKTVRLAVYETDAFDSRIDLYWETSSTGIITELNQAILDGTDAPSTLNDWVFFLSEAFDIGDIAASDFYFADALGNPLPIPIGDITLVVTDGDNNIRDEFTLVASSTPNKFNLIINDWFYYGYDALVLESYTFNFTVTTFVPSTIISYFTKTGVLTNIAPTITNAPSETLFYPFGTVNIYSFEGVNGSIDLGGRDTEDLVWSIVDGSPYFEINPLTGVLTQPSGDLPEGQYELIIRLTDAGGLIDEIEISVAFSELFGISATVTEGGPGIVATQNSGAWGSRGYITVIDGVTARVYAGAFPYPGGPNNVDASVEISGLVPVLVKNVVNGVGGGYSSTYHDLVGPGTFFFEITVYYSGAGGGTGGMYLESV